MPPLVSAFLAHLSACTRERESLRVLMCKHAAMNPRCVRVGQCRGISCIHSARELLLPVLKCAIYTAGCLSVDWMNYGSENANEVTVSSVAWNGQAVASAADCCAQCARAQNASISSLDPSKACNMWNWCAFHICSLYLYCCLTQHTCICACM